MSPERSRRILALVDDLMAASRLEASARALGWSVSYARSAGEADAALASEPPAIVLVGMASRRLPWPELVAAIRSTPTSARVPIVAFGPHLDLALRERALAAGCDAVVANSRVATDLAGLLRQYAGVAQSPPE